MKLSVATNFQDDLISKIKGKSIVELFGKLNKDFVGGVRASFLLPRVSKKQLKKHIEVAHKYSIEFNYILNSICLDNREFTVMGQRNIHGLLDWLSAIKVDALTISNPFLFQLIKRQYSRFKLYVSLIADVNSVEKAKFWEGLGAKKITLPNYLNRDFRFLEAVRKNTECDLQLVVNTSCLLHCAMRAYHALIVSHASQSWHSCKGFYIDYCRIGCLLRRLKNPVEFISSDWIRPEDIKLYEGLGFDSFKVADRAAGTEIMSSIVDAYHRRYFEGNLLDLFPSLSEKEPFKHGLMRIFKYFFRPVSINIFKVKKLGGLRRQNKEKVYIDNRVLDGFLEKFFQIDCRSISCDECGYCKSFAQKAVKFDEAERVKSLARYEEVQEDLISGEMFYY